MKRVIVSLLFICAISCDAILEVKAILTLELEGGTGFGSPTSLGQLAYEEAYPSV